MKALFLACLMAALLPASAVFACLEAEPGAKVIGPAGDPRYRSVLVAGGDTRIFDISYIREGRRITRHKTVPAGCVFRTGWWQADSGSMFKVKLEGEVLAKAWVIHQHHFGSVYRGYQRGLDCPISISE